MKICLAYPNKTLTYSETFIKNHRDYLKPDFILTGGKWPYLTMDNKSILRFPMNLNFIRAIIKRIFPGFYHVLFSRSLAEYLNRNHINVVLAEYGPTGSRMTEGCRRAAVDLMVHFHGYDAHHQETIDKNLIYYKALFGTAKKVIVVSEYMKKKLMELGLDGKKIIKIFYGVDTGLFSGAEPDKAGKIFLSVGRFTEKKAPDKTILAFRKIYSDFPEARLWMVGDGELFNECRSLVAELELDDVITFKGVLSSQQIADLHRKVCCFIQHSMKSKSGDSEGLPNTILEALSSGLPVISTNHAGIAEVIQHGENGFLVNEGDIEAMAFFMKKIILEPDIIKEMSRKARHIIVDSYNLPKQIEKLRAAIMQ